MAPRPERCAGANVVHMYTVTRVDADTFRTSRESWNTLAAAMPYPTVFCSWEWIYSWFERFNRERDRWVLFVHRDGELKGILPLFRERRWLHRDARLGQVLGYGGVPELFPDPLDIIAAQADAAACMNAILEYLRHHSGEWDVLHLRFATQDSCIARALPKADESFTRTEAISAAPYISITGSYEQYLQTLSSNERSNVRRRRRKLLEGQGVVYTDFASQEPWRVLQRLLDLHERRAAEKEIQSTFGGPAISAFHDDLLKRLNRSKVWLRGLKRGEDVIAVFYGFVDGANVAYYQLGYDPEWSDSSPGSVLLQETIREAHDRGLKEYNFLQGEEGFKYRWTSSFRPLYAVDLFNRSLFGRLSRSLIAAKRLIRPSRAQTVAAPAENP